VAVAALTFVLGTAPLALAAPPVVKTVPAVATNPLIPHDVWSGKAIRLKGTADRDGAGITYEWDPGDGNAPYTGSVTNRWVIEATHTYTGAVGTVFTAKLTVTDTNTAESAFQVFRVEIKPQELPVEVNYAIGEGLWYLHKTMVRTTLVDGITQAGHWRGAGEASSGHYSTSAANILAFEVSGHLETGDPSNPYVETVTRALKDLFERIVTVPIPNSQTNGIGTFNPDGNGNGFGVQINQSEPFYQGGMMMDAIIGSGTPNAVATTGELPSAPDPGIKGRTYGDIVQDMADFYAYCQYDGNGGGGWQYSCNAFPDSSANQWGAIGLIPAERDFGSSVSQILKDWNLVWLNTAQDPTSGHCGYTSTGPVWGPYGTTPACMVQLVLSGVGRGDPRWDKAETFMRNNFGNVGNSNQAPKSYYYGLFSFTKAMLLHDSNADTVAEPLGLLQSSTPGVAPLDWYAAEVSKGDPTDGVARTLVNDQRPEGFWTQHSVNSSDHWRFETGWAVTMLRRTVSHRPPVALVTVVPNPGVVNQQITFDCSDSFHTDPARQIVKWEWDLDGDGEFDDATGPVAMRSFDALGTYPVKCRVTDGGDENGEHPLSDDATAQADITIPPLPPTAEAGGPYLFCLGRTPWFLDGTASINPDDGIGEPGAPGDFIKEHAWDLDGDGTPDLFGAQPDVTAAHDALGTGDYVVTLKVTDNTALSAPSSGLGDLSDTDTAQVRVRPADAAECASCAITLSATAGAAVALSWTDTNAAGYNVYRSALQGGPYVKIGSTTAPNFADASVQIGTTYYYVVRETLQNGDEVCQSNEAQATATSALPATCAFAVRTTARVNDDARIEGNLTANDPGGLARIGRRARMADGTLLAGDSVSVGNFGSAFNVAGNAIAVHARGAAIRGTRTDGVTLPLADPFCPLAAFSCGGPTVVVDRRGLDGPLAPGAYDTIQVKNDATLELAPGVYDVCNLIVARKAKVVLSGGTQTVLNVVDGAKFANGAVMVPPTGTPTPALNVLGDDVRLGPLSRVQAFITAPNALIRIGKQAEFQGTFCADRGRAGHSIHLACAPGTAPPSTTTTVPTTTTTSSTEEPTTTTTTIASPDGGFIDR